MDVAAGSNSSYSGIPTGYPYERDRSFHERDRLEYELTVRQEPKQARMCGVGADRRPIDPPPIIQLRVIDPHTRQPPSPAHQDPDDGDPNYAHSFLQNPYYFMFASLAKPDDDAELHWLKDGKTRCTTGSVVSSLYHLKDTENRNEDAGFFVFPDLSVRTEGSYRLKLSLFEVVGNTVRHCKSIYSAPFYVYTAKKFPGMEESTPLSCSLADQGIKIRIRKDIRVRKRPIAALAAPLDTGEKLEDEHEHDHQDDHHHQTPLSAGPPLVHSNPGNNKRARHGTLTGPLNLTAGPSSSNAGHGHGELTTPTSASTNTGSVALAGLPAWPTATSLDPMLGVASAPGGIELTGPTHPHSLAGAGGSIPPPPGATYDGSRMGSGGIPPPPGAQLLSGGASYQASNSGGAPPRRPPIQPLSSSYTSANSNAPNATPSISPIAPPPTGTASMYDRMSYENSRPPYESSRGSYEQTPNQRGAAAYEGSRSGYDHPQQQRGSYESRGNYDSQAHSQAQAQAQRASYDTQRPSYGAPYDAPAPTGPTGQGYQDTHAHTHAQGGYSHPHQPPHPHTASGNYHNQQPSSTAHQYPAQAPSSSSQHPHVQAQTHHQSQGQYPSPTRSQYPVHTYPSSYPASQAQGQAQGRYDYPPAPAAQPQHYGGGGSTGSGDAYYDSPPPAPSHSTSTAPTSHPHAQSYYGNAPGQSTSAAPPAHQQHPSSSSSSWAPPPPIAHSQSYEYAGHQSQPQSQQSSEYYPHPSGQSSQSTRVLSPAPGSSSSTSRYYSSSNEGSYPRAPPFSSGPGPSSATGGVYNLPPPPPPGSGSAWGSQQQQQQEMIHLAPLRHAPATSSGSSPSSPSLPSVAGGGTGGGYPGMIQLSRAPFEQDGAAAGMGVGVRGLPGKKSVLSIGSIISEGG